MIRIQKSDIPPEVLRSKGANARRSHSMRFAHDPDAFHRGEKTFSFKALYKHDEVKRGLVEAQHHKCAFCESKITHVTYGDVEHFRPKAGVRQSPRDDLVRPGYYWLAYEWTNLFLACDLCNRRHKGNLFPLDDPSKRARSHHDDVSDEEPLFLHPSSDDPEQHIGFREGVAFARNGSTRGGETIAALGLNRTNTYEMRSRDYENTFSPIYYFIRYIRSGSLNRLEEREARRHLGFFMRKAEARAADQNSQYASMLRDGVQRFRREVSDLLQGSP